jgi:iron(III) transport system permease protein
VYEAQDFTRAENRLVGRTSRPLPGVGRWSVPSPNPIALLACIPAVLIVGLLAVVVWISFQPSVTSSGFTLEHYIAIYTDPLAYSAFLTTIQFSVITVVVALLFGIPIAWLIERTDVPGKSVVLTAMTMAMLAPGFATAMGWLFLLHPRIGIVNLFLQQTFGISSDLLNIVNVPGMAWVQGLTLAGLVFILTVASLRALDGSLEESAHASGAGFLQTLRRVTLPLAFPSILGAALYVLTIGISAFDIPLIMGLSNRILTFSTYLYVQTNPSQGLPDYGLPAAFGTFMIVLALLLSWLYGRVLSQARKYQVVGGKSYRRKLLQLGKWKAVAWIFLGTYILLGQLLPFLLLVWVSALPFLRAPSLETLGTVSLRNFTELPWPLVTRALAHTLTLLLLAPALSLAFSFAVSWVLLRTRNRYRFVLDGIAFLPHAVPHVVFALAASLAVLLLPRSVLDLYGSLALLVGVCTLVWISFGTRVTNAALIQIHTELEEAALTSGATVATVARRILVPLLGPAFLYGWLSLALWTFREITIATMLTSADNITLPALIWSLWRAGTYGQASALTLIVMLIGSPVALLYLRLARGGGTSRGQV